MARAKISEPAERTLDAWLTWLLEGQILIQDLPLAVSAFYFLGLAEGHASRDLEVEKLKHEANILWMQAFTPKERHAEYEQRLDQHFQEQCEKFFAEPEVPAPARFERRAA